MFGGFGAGAMGGMPQRFEECYHCYSVAYADKSHLEKGDKILLPPSAFDTLARLQVDYPMLFRLENTEKGTQTHCGVLEFTAEEGTCFIPFWMMQNLLIEEGALLTVVNVSLPKATFVKLQPQHVDFLEITNPRAVLEHSLRNFSCVTKGDVIQLPYNDKNYHFELKEVKPADAACIIETDCEVDFDAPVGYQEPTKEEMLARSRAGSEAGSMTSGGTGGTGGSSVFANMPKQSAYAPAEARSSACPSPTPSSMSGASGLLGGGGDDGADGAAKEPQGVRLVDGKIVRPEDDGMLASSAASINVDPSQVAERTGSTGVQRNAAIPDRAPQLDYWAVNAGDGARLDGKKPAPLKDKEGNEVDVRKLRAEAAARRAAAAAKAAAESSSLPPMEGSDEAAAAAKPPTVPVSKRKSRVAGKYSRLNKSNAAFQGSANKFG